MTEMEKTQKIEPGLFKSIPVSCSWCGRIYSVELRSVSEGMKTGVSHGICRRCLEAAAEAQQDEEEGESARLL